MPRQLTKQIKSYKIQLYNCVNILFTLFTTITRNVAMFNIATFRHLMPSSSHFSQAVSFLNVWLSTLPVFITPLHYPLIPYYELNLTVRQSKRYAHLQIRPFNYNLYYKSSYASSNIQ